MIRMMDIGSACKWLKKQTWLCRKVYKPWYIHCRKLVIRFKVMWQWQSIHTTKVRMCSTKGKLTHGSSYMAWGTALGGHWYPVASKVMDCSIKGSTLTHGSSYLPRRQPWRGIGTLWPLKLWIAVLRAHWPMAALTCLDDSLGEVLVRRGL